MRRLFFGAALMAMAHAAAAQRSGPLTVGDSAPDFALTGATAQGVSTEPVRLSDFRGQTVVIAFFYKARTKG